MYVDKVWQPSYTSWEREVCASENAEALAAAIGSLMDFNQERFVEQTGR